MIMKEVEIGVENKVYFSTFFSWFSYSSNFREINIFYVPIKKKKKSGLNDHKPKP